MSGKGWKILLAITGVAFSSAIAYAAGKSVRNDEIKQALDEVDKATSGAK